MLESRGERGGGAATWSVLTSPGQGRPVYKVDLSRDQKEEGEVCRLKKVTALGQ